MNKLTKLPKEDFLKIKNWIYRNARPLDIARWKYHFENGNREDIIIALSAYQNDDGGFGNTVEADSWNPNSSPFSTSTVIGILEEIGFHEQNHPLIKGILRYLDNTPEFTGKYWPAVIRSNNDYPHAPWWSFSANFEAEWGYTPTAKLAGFILRFADRGTAIYNKAATIAKEAIDKYLNGVTPDGKPYRSVPREAEVECFLYLLNSIIEINAMELGNTSELEKALREQAGMFIEKDTSKWNGYCWKPSAFINSPNSIFYKGNEEVMAAELDFILNNRNQDGVWNIPWNWGAYEREFAISENWWKATKGIEYLLLLKNFNRLEVNN